MIDTNGVMDFEEKREHIRFGLLGEFTDGVVGEKGEVYECFPVDISSRGLGLVMSPTPEDGEQIIIRVSQGELVFRVVWSKPTEVGMDHLLQMSRCGLECLDEKIDILTTFQDYNDLSIQDYGREE